MITPLTGLKRLGARLRKLVRPAKSPRRARFVPSLEGLEDRVVPALALVPQAWTGGDPFSGAVLLTAKFNDVGSFSGSGAFIDATHILTAAHCVYNPQSNDNGHYADQVEVQVGGSSGQAYWGKYMAVNPLYVSTNGVLGNHDLAVITLDPNGGYPAHYNFGVTNNADQLDYRSLQLYEIGYPGDPTYIPNLQVGSPYQTTGYASGIDTTKEWISHTPLLAYHNYAYNDAGGLSVYNGQSGSPIFALDPQGHYDVVAVVSFGDSDAAKHALPNGEGWATAMTSEMGSWVQSVLGASNGGARSVVAGQGGSSSGATASATTTTFTMRSWTVAGGTAAGLTATVLSAGGTPSGSVSFYDGSTYLGQANLQNSQAYFVTSALAFGPHSITAWYSGSSHYQASASSAQTLFVAYSRPATTTPPAALPTVASALTHSAEYYSNLIVATYQNYLNRAPAGSEVAAWVGAMQNGLSDEQLEAGFIGSPEYVANHGGQGAGWVRGMYQDLLGRAPAQAEVNGWVNALSSGTSPQQVAYGFAASAEREGARVRDDYFTFLGRNATQAEVDGWVSAFEHGARNEDVIAGFVGSAEYFQNHGSDANNWLMAAYQEILGRPADQAASNVWLPLLQR